MSCWSFQGFLPPMLVFVQSKDRARELFHELVYEGINVDVIHAERTQQQVATHTILPLTPSTCSLALLSFFLRGTTS